MELPEPVAQSVLLDGIRSIDALLVPRESLEAQMASMVEAAWHYRRVPRKGRGRRRRQEG